MKILVTGTAGFIGSSLVKNLLLKDYFVIGVDNHNDYYDVDLKNARVNQFLDNKNYVHFRESLENSEALTGIFKKYNPDIVVNLAAQAGVRFSIENPAAYVSSNIIGFTNILENCKLFSVSHLVYASTSSVYGANMKMPFSEEQPTNHPLSFYAATKKSNELMAHTYSYLFNIPTTGLRFFTVYGPWGRPDMALFKFTKKILNHEEIEIFNYGKHTRDFTYVDDIVEGISRVINKPATSSETWDGINPDSSSSLAPWRIYNIGNNNPVQLMDYVEALQESLGKKAKIKMMPLQPGDVPDTFADVSKLQDDFDYKPKTSVKLGVQKFIDWYKDYYKI